MKKSNLMAAKRQGFSLVELVVVILIIAILAVAVFAGGSAIIKKSQVSRTVSDLHNFSVAVESLLNENPSVANASAKTALTGYADKLNKNLSADYQLEVVSAALTGGNITCGAPETTDAFAIYKSAKTDAWDNNYYVVLAYDDRCESTEFYVTVISAGPNAKTVLDGAINEDDLFVLAEYKSGDVSAVTYNMGADDAMQAWDSTNHKLIALAKTSATYTTPASAPVNF